MNFNLKHISGPFACATCCSVAEAMWPLKKSRLHVAKMLFTLQRLSFMLPALGLVMQWYDVVVCEAMVFVSWCFQGCYPDNCRAELALQAFCAQCKSNVSLKPFISSTCGQTCLRRPDFNRAPRRLWRLRWMTPWLWRRLRAFAVWLVFFLG